MARDRNVYAWQAYVIVMSFVSLLCIGALIYVVFQSGTNYKTVEAAQKLEKDAQAKLRDQISKNQILESILGVGKQVSEQEFEQMKSNFVADESVNAIVKVYTNDMSLFDANAKERSYTKLVTTLMQELRDRNVQIKAAADREIEIQDKHAATIKQETEAREAEKRRSQELASQLEKEQTKYAAKEAERQQQITKIETERQAAAKAAEKVKRELTEKNALLAKDRDDLAKRVESLRRKITELEGEDFQYVQGQITGVADGGETVYLNLGKADGLREGVRFGVVSEDTTRVADAKPKARLEIVSVMQDADHVSRAKVLPDRRHATILQGDKVYSPAWQPGRNVQFALIGKMDINGDGQDDREIIKNLITQNGAQVTMDLPPSGRQEGELTENTRWLVIGEELKVSKNGLDASSEGVAKKRAEIEFQAKALGISKINLDKLMGWLRGSGEQDVVPLGTALRSSDFKRRNAPTSSTGRVSNLFQDQGGKPVVPEDNP